jgi:CBS domain-containing protein
MLKLRDIMTPDLPVVAADTTRRSALELFAHHGLTGALVLDGGTVVGVVSAADVLTPVAIPAVAGAGGGRASAYFTEQWSKMKPEVDSRLEEWTSHSPDRLAERTVGEIMTRAICALPPDTAVTVAASYMQRVNVRRLLVLSGRTIEGIVTKRDITRAVAGGRRTIRRFVHARGGDSAA